MMMTGGGGLCITYIAQPRNDLATSDRVVSVHLRFVSSHKQIVDTGLFIPVRQIFINCFKPGDEGVKVTLLKKLVLSNRFLPLLF
jgi:hypothetical protein